MLRILSRDLPEPLAAKLLDWQAEVDANKDYATRVTEAARLFHSRNQPTIPTFKAIRDTLSAMCSGAQRCMYCEDSAATQVEHIYPKSLYPEYVFAWTNLLYACSGCNGPKNNNFAILDGLEEVCVARRRSDPIAPPRRGPIALLDPRSEDPTEFLEIDLQDSFRIQPRASLPPLARVRAEYTIRTLGFNKQEVLVRTRRSTYRQLKRSLERYAQDRHDERFAVLDQIEHDIRTSPHPTVWFEMRRQHLNPELQLQPLFARVPEALAWDWLPDAD